MLPKVDAEKIVPMPPCKSPKAEFEFIEVNLPFGWGDVDFEDESNPDNVCFRDDHDLKPGMILDCLTNRGREVILIGDVNVANGSCGCCSIGISFVYRFAQIDIPGRL